MSQIPGTAYVLRGDGSFEIGRRSEQSSPLKRTRAPSTASSCTLHDSTPASSASNVEIIDRPNLSKIITPPEPEFQIIDRPIAPRKSIVPAQKRAKSNTNSPSGSVQSQQSQPRPTAPTAIDLDGFEELHYGPGGIIDVDALEEKFEALFYGSVSQAQARAEPVATRNLPIRFPQEEIEKFSAGGVHIKKGKTVEFLNGSFLKVAKIIKNSQTGEVVLRGWSLKRCSQMNGILPKKLNEVCFVLDVELDDPRPVMEQAMVQVGVEGIVKLRHLISTNYPHPHLGFCRTDLPYDLKSDNMEYIRDYEKLVVRWKFVTYFDNAVEHYKNPCYPTNVRKRLLTRLTEEECTPKSFMDPTTLRNQWRGDTIMGGSGAMEPPQSASLIPDQGTSSHPYECQQCGKGFNRAEILLQHFQTTHELQAQRCRPKPRRHQASIIEIFDDDEKEGNRDSQRRRVSKQQVEDIRVRLGSILSIDGDKIISNDKARNISRDGRKIDVDLTTPESSGQKLSEADRKDHTRIEAAGTSRYAKQRPNRSGGSTYTYGDAFCGAGGTTRGAVAAALRVVWGLDLDKNAGKTWKSNFPGATHYEMWAHDLMAMIRVNTGLLVDILHLSPPCQVFSPVHTRVGKNDQQNFDSLFACDALVHRARPRIITLEQTFGILHPKFEAAFNSLIQTFTSYGYSVSYQIVQFQNYGLAQTRRRLIIFAACPGETLPELPKYTHSKTSSSLKPLTSVRSVLNRVPASCANHDIAAAYARPGKKGVWDASTAIATITCDGGVYGHPDGERGFTLRELAALQSFPNHHVFHGAAIKKQIGNAVPPLIAEILFKAITKHLRKVDKAEQERLAEVIE